MAFTQTAAVIAIDGYRRFVSPYKGFSCAHHRLHGRGSCSDFGREAFATHAIGEAFRQMRLRFAECKAAAATLHEMAAAPAFDGRRPQATSEAVEDDKEQDEMTMWRNRACDCANPCQPPTLDCSPPSGAVDLCSVSDACACSW